MNNKRRKQEEAKLIIDIIKKEDDLLHLGMLSDLIDKIYKHKMEIDKLYNEFDLS